MKCFSGAPASISILLNRRILTWKCVLDSIRLLGLDLYGPCSCQHFWILVALDGFSAKGPYFGRLLTSINSSFSLATSTLMENEDHGFIRFIWPCPFFQLWKWQRSWTFGTRRCLQCVCSKRMTPRCVRRTSLLPKPGNRHCWSQQRTRWQSLILSCTCSSLLWMQDNPSVCLSCDLIYMYIYIYAAYDNARL